MKSFRTDAFAKYSRYSGLTPSPKQKNVNPAHHIGDRMTQMAVEWPRLENAADSNSPNCSQMDTRWKTGERKTERNLEKNSGARNERT